jgi:hypothetical protein
MYTNKANPIIEKIELTEEQKQEIHDVMDGKPSKKLVERWDKEGTRTIHERHYRPRSSLDRLKKIRNNYFKGGKCAICQKFPLYKLIYKLDYGSVVEYYCQEHFEKSGIKC